MSQTTCILWSLRACLLDISAKLSRSHICKQQHCQSRPYLASFSSMLTAGKSACAPDKAILPINLESHRPMGSKRSPTYKLLHVSFPKLNLNPLSNLLEDPRPFGSSQPLPQCVIQQYMTGTGQQCAEGHALCAAGSSQEEGADWHPAWGGGPGTGAGGGGGVHCQHCRHSSGHPLQVSLPPHRTRTVQHQQEKVSLMLLMSWERAISLLILLWSKQVSPSSQDTRLKPN